MENISITKLPLTILDKLNFLKKDYVGLYFDVNVILRLILGFSISLSLIIISYLIGKKIIDLLFKKEKLENNYLINIAIGYITIATGITILGLFSILTPIIISVYLILLLIISFYPYSNFLTLLRELYNFLFKTINNLKKNKMVLTWVSLFIFLAVINLINPEVREDQYHVDFPKMYLNNQTIMILPKEGFNVSGSPMLGEMYYTIGIFLWSQESARYIHFIFYILVLLTLLEFSKVNDYKFSIYNLLLFASAPVVIHETSSMYVDFEWMFCFLLSILILTLNKKLLSKRIVISGFILGGMLASKLWTIVFIPVSIIYLLILLSGLGINEKFKKISLFILSSLVAPLLWFIRAYILTGDPLFPAFFHNSTSTNNGIYYYLSHYLGLNNTLLNPYNLINVFSPLFFLGCIIFLYKFKQNLKEFLKLDIFKYLILLFLVFISIQYSYGRYLMGLYILLIFFSSLGLSKFISDFKFTKYLINFFLILFYLYYFVNSILILPYSLGITDRNKYLTRILSRDNSSYYNFNRQFEKYIFKNDYVATYGIFGYYYADFRYLNVNFVIDQKENSFDILKKNEFTKLFIKGGDINWFCLKENIKNCEKSKYTYLSSYMGTLPYYLYDIK